MTVKADPRHHHRLRHRLNDGVDELRAERVEASLDHLRQALEQSTLRDLAEAILARNGHTWSDDELLNCRTAFSSVEGQDALLGLISTSILEGMEEQPDHSEGWTERRGLPDFLQAMYSHIDQPPRLEKLNRGDSAPTIQFRLQNQGFHLCRFAVQWVVDEQDLLDHKTLDIHMRALREVGKAAKRLIPDLCFATVLENPSLDSDSTQLFHSDHDNTSSDPLASEALQDAMVAVSDQTLTDHDGVPSHLNLSGQYLIVAPQLIGTARTLARSLEVEGSTIEVRSESRLGAAGSYNPVNQTVYQGSSSAWMLAAPARQRPTMVICARDGRFQPSIRQFELSGGQWGFGHDLVYDVAVAPVDFRGLFFSDGSG